MIKDAIKAIEEELGRLIIMNYYLKREGNSEDTKVAYAKNTERMGGILWTLVRFGYGVEDGKVIKISNRER